MGHWFRMVVIQSLRKASKIGVFDNEKCILEEIVEHTIEPQAHSFSFQDLIYTQKEELLEFLHLQGMNLTKVNAVICRGNNVQSGVWEITQKGLDSANLADTDEFRIGAEIALQISKQLHIPALWVHIEESVPLQHLAYIANQYLNSRVILENKMIQGVWENAGSQ